jgi:hypothetical protein
MTSGERGGVFGRATEHVLPVPPDIRLRLPLAAPVGAQPAVVPGRLPAHSRDERRLARIDRRVAARDTTSD